MNRDIKFRAWHKQEQKMYPVMWIIKDMVLIEVSDEVATVISIEQVELMQYTGLKDSKGTEIFEGDIVRYDAFGIHGIVTWVATGPGFSILRPEKSGACVLHSEWEVLGNRYEHSHLLPKVTP